MRQPALHIQRQQQVGDRYSNQQDIIKQIDTTCEIHYAEVVKYVGSEKWAHHDARVVVLANQDAENEHQCCDRPVNSRGCIF